MADARDDVTWSHHAKQLVADFDREHAPSHINVPQLKKWAALFSGEGKVLDFGCGVGLWREIFEGLDYTGCDQNQDMIDAAQGKWPEDKFVKHRWEQLPFSDKEFDLLFTRAVIMHNSNDDKGRVLSEMNRVLKLGGHYIASESTFTPSIFKKRFEDKDWDPNYTDGFTFTSVGWAELMKGYGFELKEYVAPKAYLFKKIRHLD